MKRKKPKIELRYYYMPAGSPILPLLGERWVQNYGTGIEDLHFHNFMEIGFCYYGEGTLTPLEVHGRIDGFYFLGFVLRDKIQTPDILVIFITFNENCVQIFVNILFKFL